MSDRRPWDGCTNCAPCCVCGGDSYDLQQEIDALTADRDHWRDCCAPLKGAEMIQIAMGSTIEANREIVDLKDEIEHLKRQVVEADSWATDHRDAQAIKIVALREALAEACDLAEHYHETEDDFSEAVRARIMELRSMVNP